MSDLQLLDEVSANPKRTRGVALLSAVRVHQWLKNILIFVPAVLARPGDSFHAESVFIAFLLFSMLASSVYLLNDLLDLENDRRHPRKCKRAIASGSLRIVDASFGMVTLWAISIGGGFLLDPLFGIAMLGYFVLTTAYSISLKTLRWWDIGTLGTLYTWRVVSGAVVATVPLSPWLVTVCLCFFSALAGLKRLSEVESSLRAGLTHRYGRAYQTGDAGALYRMSLILIIIALATLVSYSFSSTAQTLYEMPKMFLGMAGILSLWFAHMLGAIRRGHMHDDPLVYALRDPLSWVMATGIVGCFGVAIGWL